MKKNDEPTLWRTLLALVLVLGLALLIALVGLALWFSEKAETSAPLVKPDRSWGIATDSPIRHKH
jgi:type IV secretory pathway TrbD component